MSKPRICVLTGAGISAESGVPTYRGGGGLWDGQRLEDIASPAAWARDPDLVSDFYDARRTALGTVQPNAGHRALVDLAAKAEVCIVTQNVDDLHERAGSSTVLHMHGELRSVCSDRNHALRRDIGYQPAPRSEPAPDGGRWRPAVVWFGEMVQHAEEIMQATEGCDEFWIIGTSLQVYPAASLVYSCQRARRILLIDPQPETLDLPNLQTIAQPAGSALPQLVAEFC